MTAGGDALIARALKDCVSGVDSSALRHVVATGLLPSLVDAARYHRILNMVYLAVRDVSGVDEELRAALERYYLHQIGHHLRALGDLRALETVLAGEDVPWLLVKGPVLSEAVYERPDLRVYNDLDVVIERQAFPRAIDALGKSGYELLDRNWELIRREGRAQLHLALRLGTVADVHHHLLNRLAVRHSLTLPMGSLFERATSVALGDVTVRTLDPEDTVLHLCVHASLAGGDRLLWMKDIEQAVRRRPVDWDDAIRRARAWRAGSLAGVILQRARVEIDAPIPDPVVDAMFASTSRRSVSARIDRTWPASRSRGRITPSLMWAQVIRDSWAATTAAFVGRAMRRLRKTPHRGEEDWQHSMGHADEETADASRERSRYLHDVDEPSDPRRDLS